MMIRGLIPKLPNRAAEERVPHLHSVPLPLDKKAAQKFNSLNTGQSCANTRICVVTSRFFTGKQPALNLFEDFYYENEY